LNEGATIAEWLPVSNVMHSIATAQIT